MFQRSALSSYALTGALLTTLVPPACATNFSAQASSAKIWDLAFRGAAVWWACGGPVAGDTWRDAVIYVLHTACTRAI